MTERENLLHTLKRDGQAEWVPVIFDCYDVMIPTVVLERPNMGASGDDWFGCSWIWDPAQAGFAQDPRIPFPCSDITKWKEQVKFPDLDALDWAGSAVEDLKNVDRENKLILMFMESGPFERLHSLLGFEDAFIAMYEEPEAFHELMQACTEHRIRLMRKLKEYFDADTFFNMDDLGSQNGALMSVDTYREFLKPYHIQLVNECHRLGMFFDAHTCGKMDSLVGELVDVGVDVINPIQSINDQKWLAETYGTKVVFEGGYDNLIHMPDTTEEELIADVHRAIDTLAQDKTFIYMNNATVYPERIPVLGAEAKKYGYHYWDKK